MSSLLGARINRRAAGAIRFQMMLLVPRRGHNRLQVCNAFDAVQTTCL
jgi:hypothetical protein